MRHRVRHSRSQEDTELNVTPFMNLMVVLVPFLLLMAVFTQITVVELALPGDNIEKNKQEPPLQLEVVLRKDRIDVQDRATDLLGQYPRVGDKDDIPSLRQKLVEIKEKFPNIKAVSLLAEGDVDYGRIIEIMDVVRSRHYTENDETMEQDLFTDIALGKANILEAVSESKNNALSGSAGGSQ